MRQTSIVALSTVLLLAISACGQPTATQSVLQINKSQSTVAQAIAQANAPIVKDLGNKSGPSVAVSIQTAAAQRKVQALQHRWTSADITSYHVTLTAQSTGTAIATIDIPAASFNTSTGSQVALAAFTGLPANDKYAVNVVAMGSNATTPATTASQSLNTQTPATAVFDFTESADHNIDTVASQNVTIALDSFAFSGTGNLGAQVADATFKAPPTAVGAAAVVPAASVAADVFSAWGYDIVSINYSNLDITTPILCNDGSSHAPNSSEAVALDGNWYGPSRGDWGNGATTTSYRLQWWYYAGQWNGLGVTTVGVRTTFDNGNGVNGKGPIQAKTNSVVWH